MFSSIFHTFLPFTVYKNIDALVLSGSISWNWINYCPFLVGQGSGPYLGIWEILFLKHHCIKNILPFTECKNPKYFLEIFYFLGGEAWNSRVSDTNITAVGRSYWFLIETYPCDPATWTGDSQCVGFTFISLYQWLGLSNFYIQN